MVLCSNVHVDVAVSPVYLFMVLCSNVHVSPVYLFMVLCSNVHVDVAVSPVYLFMVLWSNVHVDVAVSTVYLFMVLCSNVHVAFFIQVIVLQSNPECHVVCVSFVRRDGTTFALTFSFWQRHHTMEIWLAITFTLLISAISECRYTCVFNVHCVAQPVK